MFKNIKKMFALVATESSVEAERSTHVLAVQPRLLELGALLVQGAQQLLLHLPNFVNVRKYSEKVRKCSKY